MPKPRNHNPSVYIILCGGRINVLKATDAQSVIAAASDCAVQAVSLLEVLHPGEMTVEQAEAVTALQHYMMDNMSMGMAEAQAKAEDLFTLVDQLADQFEGHEY